MIRAVVTDIEGTTSSLSFVKDVLFPYARRQLPDYVRQHGGEPAVRALLDDARELMGTAADDNAVVAQMLAWIDEDKKVTPLKSLQGLIWEAGYRNGDFTGHVYEDAVDCLRQWHDQAISLYVYSSGSVYAQKLLFSHTEFGDLTPLFSGYFDTSIGHKREAPSYSHIIGELGLPADQVMFLSDIVEELDAAAEAGMNTTWLVRGTEINGNAVHRQVDNFHDIEL
ncbi:MAG: acireductone synthase [Gammaproteobacteria bacterium]|nr:acireductone synthase [Gammaproteobacteria bacterium]